MNHCAAPPNRLAALAAGVVAVTLSTVACGADSGAEPARSYSVELRADDSADEYLYLATEPFDLRVRDEVTFEFDNTGALPHDLQVVDPGGRQIGISEVAGPGATTSVTVLFEEAGFYRLNCLVDDHLTEHGMQAIVEVTDA